MGTETELIKRRAPTLYVIIAIKLLKGLRDWNRSEEHTSELQSLTNLVCRLLLEKKKDTAQPAISISRGLRRARQQPAVSGAMPYYHGSAVADAVEFRRRHEGRSSTAVRMPQCAH